MIRARARRQRVPPFSRAIVRHDDAGGKWAAYGGTADRLIVPHRSVSWQLAGTMVSASEEL